MKKHSTAIRILCAILCVVLFAGLVGCGNQADKPSDNPDPDTTSQNPAPTGNPTLDDESKVDETRNVLNVRTGDIAGVLIPYQGTKNIDHTLNWNLYDTLVRAADTYMLDLQPSLAEKWEISDDGMVYTFYLRDDVNFHNGDHFTAKDVAYTWEQIKNSATVSGKAATMESWEIVDDYTIKLYLNQPNGSLINLFATYAFGIVNQRAIEEHGQAEGAFVGTGPYILDTYNPNELIVLKANEDYFAGAPAMKTVNIKVITDSNSALIAFRNGEIDELQGVPYLDSVALQKDPNVTVFDLPTCRVGSVIFNTTMAPFDNIYFRQAINYALDREAISLIASDGVYIPIQVPVTPSHPGYTTEADYPYDPAKAIELLKQSGLSEEEMTITFTHSLESDIVKLATAIQDQLKEVGINVILDGYDRSVSTQKILAKEVEMVTFTYGGSPYNPANTFGAVVATTGNWNMSMYTGPRADEMNELIIEAGAEQDPAKSEQLYIEAMKIFREDALSAPIYNIVTQVAINKDLKGVYLENSASLAKFDQYYWAAN